MYYQLTLQFATSEIDDAKKVLELAKELDLKRAGLGEKLPEPETFPWEEEAPKLQTITALEKLVGKKDFAEIVGEYIEKPQGKPTLVPVSDKRPEIGSVTNDFKDGID